MKFKQWLSLPLAAALLAAAPAMAANATGGVMSATMPK